MTAWLAVMLIGGCGVHSPERVQRLAARAAVDPDRTRRLTHALADRDREVWEEAYGALLELGPLAVPSLRSAVERRRPEAGRALLVLGEMGDPDQVPLLRAALGHRSLDPFARTALELAERHLYERVEDAPDPALVAGYLHQFPRGPHLEAVRAAGRELTALGELEALGAAPAPGALIRIERVYGDTRAGERARALLARQALVDAGVEIGRGRGGEALRFVEEARDWEPELDVSAMEAAARAALGKELVDRHDLDGAIAELEASWAIAGRPQQALGGLYLERARRDFKRRQVLDGMVDLRRTEAVDPDLQAAVDGERAARTPALIAAAERPGADPAVFGALLLAGRGRWAELERLLRAQLERGDGAGLGAVTEAAWSAGGRAEQRWTEALLTQLLFEVDGTSRGLLGDPASVLALVDPPDPWSSTALEDRREAAPLLGAYVGVVAAAHLHLARGGVIDGALPVAPPRALRVVADWLAAGGDPRDPGLPRLDRAQLLLAMLAALDEVEGLARRQPAALVAALAVRDALPVTALEWSRLSELSGGDGVARIGGRDARISALTLAGTVRVEIALAGASEPLDDGTIGDALTALFAGGRPLLAVRPGASRVEVLVGMDSGHGGLDVRARLALSRQQVAAVDWDALAEAAPLGAAQLRLVADRSVR